MVPFYAVIKDEAFELNLNYPPALFPLPRATFASSAPPPPSAFPLSEFYAFQPTESDNVIEVVFRVSCSVIKLGKKPFAISAALYIVQTFPKCVITLTHHLQIGLSQSYGILVRTYIF